MIIIMKDEKIIRVKATHKRKAHTRKIKFVGKEKPTQIDKIPTKKEFYNQEYWYDPKRGQHPASGSGRLPTKEIALFEIISIGGEPVIKIYNPYTKEEILYYDLNQMDEAKERFKNLYDETFEIKKSSLDPDNLVEINSIYDAGIEIVGGIHEEETFICKFKDGSSSIHKVMDKIDIIGEVGSYETSKIIGWDVIPETIQCDYGKGVGSSQKWIPDSNEPYDGFNDNTILLEEKHLGNLSKIFIMDMILGNFDRHEGNLIIDKNDHVWGIDNEMIGKLNSAELHIEELNKFIRHGYGMVPMLRILNNNLGEDLLIHKSFKDKVDVNLKIVLNKKDEIIKYWSQYEDSKDFNTTNLLKAGIQQIKKNIKFLENYRNKL